MDFIKTALEPEPFPANAYFYIFFKNSILIQQTSKDLVSIPCIDKKTIEQLNLNELCFFGTYKGTPCYSARITHNNLPDNLSGNSQDILSVSYKLINLRSLYGKIDIAFWSIAGYARQIFDWNIHFKFCGKCGIRTTRKKNEHARECTECKLIHYPRISPAIITAVIKDKKILLARGINFPDKKMFSVLAGFVEPGETLEACVKREILEEVGITVRNITYFGSQSWPFPDSLMIGFTAEYEKGNISIDTEEILEAHWFTAKNLPVIPGKQTIAGKLIEWFSLQN
ncbi:MAG: NAD(+) diphosphatase [Desulfobacula sp.]|jgi:NAD+ diphosphatase|uniref:NAD(+) diphosphatase n=2 Tax=Desulfobacula sp. TaxID=2593537 RepID=UPI001DF59558|nr:NAD(+) diphosphatase [Desulfobacula sp.]MBT7710624.1 NAD(+) diphosphatase [Deltaproteobacteria bacterium]MBT3806208.1 NAD(+) diphosphatase [Desulfobacula sp.]MBT4025305.1 NAD(+) diphosphatase [Desulfobacula sp.]MBT4199366.1 NAD(+) diphosphatase [Desulfobacula sp.]